MNIFNFHLTDACNYRCAYCFGKFPDKKELTFEQACRVVDNIARYFSKNRIADRRVNLAGGEPLLCSYLDDLINYIFACGIKVSVITNGSLLTDERISSWKDKVYCIGLSLDSALSGTNAKIGRCCSCNNKTLTVERAEEISQTIHCNDIKLKINTVVSKLNVNEDMTVFYKRLKPDRLKFLQVEIVNGINDAAAQYQIDKKAFVEFCERHRACGSDIVCEQSNGLENSYLMINPQGEFQLNDFGKYKIYGNCLEEDVGEIIKRTPIDVDKFNSRYVVEPKTEKIHIIV